MLPLTLNDFKQSIKIFLDNLMKSEISELYGVTDGKKVGTYIEVLLNDYLTERFTYTQGNSATGIDFPELELDLKVTSIIQPQSSSPFKSADQKIYGLGYNLLVLVYEKTDNRLTEKCHLDFLHAVYIDKNRTGDFQMTKGVLEILKREPNIEDLIAFFEDKNLPADDIGRTRLAERVLSSPPEQGYLTISNALQWRLQYQRVITVATTGNVDGIENVFVEKGNQS